MSDNWDKRGEFIKDMTNWEKDPEPFGSAALTGWPYQVPEKEKPYSHQVAGNHYQDMAIQPHEYIVKNNIPWSAANAIKYLSRYRKKGGKQDLLKAKHYIELAIAEEYPE